VADAILLASYTEVLFGGPDTAGGGVSSTVLKSQRLSFAVAIRLFPYFHARDKCWNINPSSP